MPTLGSYSLWTTQAPNTLVTNLPADTLVTSSIFPGEWVTEGEQVTLNLWMLEASGSVVEITGVILTMRLPDKSIVNLQSVAGLGLPPVNHVTGSGLWTVAFSAVQPGPYSYTWNLSGAYLWSGYFYATQHAAP